MAPLLPRMNVFEFDDQPWFPVFLRGRVQATLTILWSFKVPLLQIAPPSSIVVEQLLHYLGERVRDYVFIDFCAGGGGPTPFIEQRLNAVLSSQAEQSSNGHVLENGNGHAKENGHANGNANGNAKEHAKSYAEALTDGQPNGHANGHANGSPTEAGKHEPIRFVLTDLRPHVENWSRQAEASPNISYVAESVDASDAPASLISQYKDQGKKVFRLFFLAFHHFDDTLARAILKNTVENSDGFAIFELQERTFVSLMTLFMFGLAAIICAPYYAWKWRSPGTLFFSWIIPVLPFVLTFDGWMSALRTRTPEEVNALLQTCGADPAEIARWQIQSGRKQFFRPQSYVHWIVCERK